MSYLKCLRGIASGVEYPRDAIMNLDPIDGRPVEMIIDLERLKAEQPNAAWYNPSVASLWRFGGLLALDLNDPVDAAHIGALTAGHTPLLEYSAYPPAHNARIELQIKDEGKAHTGFGYNPTLSFKDRGMVMVVANARRLGLQRLAVPTQGNAGDSLVHFALSAGIKVVVAMPDTTPMPIQGRVAAAALRYPEQITLTLQGPTIREAGAYLKEHYVPQGYFSVATFQEPGWRIEGKKTLGLEIAEPRPGTRTWQLPDVVIYPTGGGTGVLGMWKAWNELEALGLIDSHRPRLYCVQSDVTQPLVAAYQSNARDTIPVTAGSTTATGLNVPGGVGHARVLEIVRQSGGAAIAVSERDIADQLTATWNFRHDWLSPEGAACLAALPQLCDLKCLSPGERVVVVNTGSLEKYLPDIRHLLG